MTVRWGAEVGQLAPSEARAHGLVMLEAAEAADSDAAILRALHEAEFDDEVGFGMLRMIREHRASEKKQHWRP